MPTGTGKTYIGVLVIPSTMLSCANHASSRHAILGENNNLQLLFLTFSVSLDETQRSCLLTNILICRHDTTSACNRDRYQFPRSVILKNSCWKIHKSGNLITRSTYPAQFHIYRITATGICILYLYISWHMLWRRPELSTGLKLNNK